MPHQRLEDDIKDLFREAGCVHVFNK